MRRRCQRTCLKKGKDSKACHWSRPFTHNEPVVVSTKKYPSRCAYYKERRLCKHGHYRFKLCRRTCKACHLKVPARYRQDGDATAAVDRMLATGDSGVAGVVATGGPGAVT